MELRLGRELKELIAKLKRRVTGDVKLFEKRNNQLVCVAKDAANNSDKVEVFRDALAYQCGEVIDRV